MLRAPCRTADRQPPASARYLGAREMPRASIGLAYPGEAYTARVAGLPGVLPWLASMMASSRQAAPGADRRRLPTAQQAPEPQPPPLACNLA
ncbi:hypothetical protein TOPH_02138 [Tolypocladium ophioglossoides CBS 100239]|uniref:Uncharacterized protein n=1 Tax=Tolypocladium ophioglossoides (strain CBS 100239) TaxID=1163406 RepID=A0A0L0NG67_TOLOC|nr:hypothetical protein TOPH_02138 [Tolypocladium ophioglossoides CBS 100239]